MASGIGAECSSFSAVDPVTIRPSGPSAEDPITSVLPSTSRTASTSADDTERPVAVR
jgi:hypothetical protein